MKLTKNQKLIFGGLIVVFILANSNVVEAGSSPPREPRKEYIQSEVRNFQNFMRASNPGVHEEL